MAGGTVAVAAARKVGVRRILAATLAMVVLLLAGACSAVALPAMAIVAANGNNIGTPELPEPGQGGPLVPSESGWWRPVPGPLTSLYGPRRIICNASGCSTPFHQGLDFGSGCGTPMVAVYAGTVTFAGNAGGFGNRVIVDHGGGIETIYGHIQNSSTFVQVGQQVDGGDQIALVGDTGVGTGCHLDLKVRIDGVHTDPQPFLRGRGVDV